MSHAMTSVLGVFVLFHLFLLPGTDKEQRIYEKQHMGILLLNIPLTTWYVSKFISMCYKALSVLLTNRE